MLPTWWRNLKKWISSKSARPSRFRLAKLPHQCRPHFEQMEDRTLPSAWPFVQSIVRTSPMTAFTNGNHVAYTVTFSEPVTGVDPGDFVLVQTGTVNAIITQVTPVTSAVYTVTVDNISGTGTVGLNLVDNGSIGDLSGDPLTQSGFPVSFQDPTLFATRVNSVKGVLADVNGDGIPDLVVCYPGTASTGSINVLLGNGNGTFQEPLSFASGGGTYAVAVTDLTGDGKQDIVVANFGGIDTISVLMGNGNGTFQNRTTYSAGGNPYSLAIADFTGDGKLDIAVADPTPCLLLGNGNGTFQAPMTLFSGTVGIRSVAAADLTGDGKADLVFENFYGAIVLLGNGNGTFQQAVTYATPTPQAVAVAEVTGDGIPDIICPNGPNGTVSVLLGNGNGTFQSPLTYLTGLYPNSVAVGDLTGDGHADLVVGNRFGSSVSVLLGNGDGTFQARTDIGCGAYPESEALADVNGDGKVDIVVFDENQVAVLLGNGDGTFSSVGTGTQPDSVALADFAGNGMLDIALANFKSDTIGVLLGTGGDRFQNQTTYLAGFSPASVIAADVNGDGIPDLVFTNEIKNGDVGVMLGNGNGTFQNFITFAAGAYPQRVFAADLTGDGIEDLVVDNLTAPGTISVLLGNGDGTFQSPLSFNTGGDPIDVTVADVNGDGIPDVVVANLNSADVAMLLGNGNGTFQSPLTIATGKDPGSPLVADLNGDGKPDLVISNSYADFVSVLLGNGNGTFQKQMTFATSSHPYYLALADFSGDGKLDLAVTTRVNVNILLGNGNGTFQSFTTFQAGADPTYLAVGDVNGDGRPDLVLAGILGNTVSPLLNTSNGDFTGPIYTIVNPAAATQLVIIASPNPTTAGGAVAFTVTAEDQFGEIASAFAQTVHFSSSDAMAVVPADATLTNGVGTFTAIFITAGSDTLTASGTGNPGVTGALAITVNPGPATHFAFSSFSTAVEAGNGLVLALVARDSYNNIASTYKGTVHFTSSDPKAQLPANTTLTAGVGFFAAELKTAGNQTFTVTDTGNLSATTQTIAVSAAAATHFGVIAPPTAITGSPLAVTVTALDPYGNTVPTYASTVHFTSSDSAAALPPDSTFSGGSGVFSATLATSGNQTVAVSNNASGMKGISAAIAVRGLIVTGLVPTATGFAASFDKPFDPTTLSLYYAPDDVLLVNGSGGVIRGSLALNTASGAPPDTSFTFVATSGVLAAGTYTVTLVSGSSGITDTSGIPLDGTDSGVPGNNYVTTFTVASTPSVVLSIPDFARGPNSTANILLPNNTGSGIPITLTGAANLTDITFNLTFNPALLNISGTLNGPSGAFTLQSNSAGVASFAFQSSSPLNGTITLGYVLAQVPNSAATSYKSKALLHLGNIVIHGSSTTAANDDGIEAVAYLGDVAGTGSFSPLDAALIGQVAVGIDTGFSAFEQLDPAIIGDVGDFGTGNTNSTDVTLMNRLLAGIAAPQIPQPPAGLIIPPTGPDPTLSVPLVSMATAGDTFTVPVKIDTARPGGSNGLMEATLALSYNPQVFSLTAADIKLGTVPSSGSGWQLGVAINPETGEIGINLFSTTPIQSAAGGSLVTITLHARGMATVGQAALTLVDEVNPTGLRSYQTGLADGQGALAVSVDQPARGSVQIGVGDAGRAWDGNSTKAAMVTDVQTTAHHSLFAASWPDLEQIFADADGMAAEQSPLLPQQPLSQLFAEDCAQLLGGVEMDPTTSQAGDLSLLLSHAVAGRHLDDADPDTDLAGRD